MKCYVINDTLVNVVNFDNYDELSAVKLIETIVKSKYYRDLLFDAYYDVSDENPCNYVLTDVILVSNVRNLLTLKLYSSLLCVNICIIINYDIETGTIIPVGSYSC